MSKPSPKWAALLGAVSAAAGHLHVPRIFSDGAVLQVWDEGDARAFAFGSSAPNVAVSLTISSENASLPFSRTYHTESLSNGKFSFQLDGTYAADPLGRHGPHYGPYTLLFSSEGEEKRVSGVTYGDVYICAGDEAMREPLSDQQVSPPPHIHRFIVAEARSSSLADDVEGEWQTGGERLANFSALCYRTALALAKLNPAGTDAGSTTGGDTLPIAVILAAVDGSELSEWAPSAAVGACGSGSVGASSALYNGMVAPLRSLALRGVLFSHQGGADRAAGTPAAQYGACMARTFTAWRDGGEIGDFAVAFTQVSADFAWQTAQALSLPRPFTDGKGTIADTTAIAPTYDLSSAPNSAAFTEAVAARLALGIAHVSYSKQEPEWPWSPPLPLDAAISYDGSSVDIRFGGRRSLALALQDMPNCTRAAAAGSDCCSSGGGTLIEAKMANGQWVRATELHLLPASGDRSTQVLRVGSPDWLPSSPPALVRMAASPGFGCVLRNRPNVSMATAVGMPVLPCVISITANGTALPLDSPSARGAAPPSLQAAEQAVTPPPMGFNSWNRWHCWVDEQQLKRTADLLVSLGLAAAGYTFLNVDDCWQAGREWDVATGAFNGSIMADPVRFPAGLKAFSAYVHGKGLKWGLYTSQSSVTCQARPGSYQHEALDAHTYCDTFDADYLKIDHCGGDGYATNNHSWMLFRSALDACAARRGRKFWVACSSCGPTPCLENGTCTGPSGCGKWIASGPVSCDVWRTGGDIQARWSSIMANLDANALMAPVQNGNPGHFNDPDMLQVGNVGLTLVEQRSHFACWCMLGGPLLISTDLSKIDDAALGILKASELIGLNQDRLATQGVRVGPRNATGAEVWVKRLSGGRHGVVLLNRGDTATSISFDLAVLSHAPSSRWVLRDLWAEKDLGTFSGVYTTAPVPSHGNVALLAARPS